MHKDQTQLVIDRTGFPFSEGSRIRHKKSGGIYMLLHYGRIEASLEVCAIYQDCNSGLVWVRPTSEMHDGRFEAC